MTTVQQGYCTSCHRTCTMPPGDGQCLSCRAILSASPLANPPARPSAPSFWTTWGHILLGILVFGLPILLLYGTYRAGYGSGQTAGYVEGRREEHTKEREGVVRIERHLRNGITLVEHVNNK